MSAVADERNEEYPEDELRVLLHRAVPQLPSPAQRLERVRARVTRRRRRRTAALSVTAVAAAVAVSLTVPGLLHSSDGGGAPVGAAPAPTAVTHAPTPDARLDPTPTPIISTTLDRYTRVEFRTLGGLTLTLPRAWSRLESADVSFAASQQMSGQNANCKQPMDGYCSPLVKRLPSGGALVVLRPKYSRLTADKVRVSHQVYAPELTKSCLLAGGTQVWEALIADPARPGSDLVVDASVCLSRPTKAQSSEARSVLTTASFS